MKKKLKNEFLGWKKIEILWLFIACAIITALSIYWGDTLIGIISATTGVACVIFTAKGKLSAYFFGLINCVLYAIIAFNAKFYGEVCLNILYYAPLQFYGFYVWQKNINQETHEVNKKRMSNKLRLVLATVVIISTVVYGYLLNILGGELPYVDALSTVISVVAMIVSIKMYTEQWVLWIVVNIVTVIMWVFAFANGSDSIATLLMWMVYLLNSIFAFKKWEKETENIKMANVLRG